MKPRQLHPRAWTQWINPKMTNYKMGCCDCGLEHLMNFRVIEVVKEYKTGVRRVRALPKNKYQIQFKAKRVQKKSDLYPISKEEYEYYKNLVGMRFQNKTLEKLSEDEHLKRAFDLWLLTFDVKDGVGERPDFDSLINALQYEIKKYLV